MSSKRTSNKYSSKKKIFKTKLLLLIVGIFVLVIGSILFFYPKKNAKTTNVVWYVDEGIATNWEKILAEAPKEFAPYHKEGSVKILGSETPIPADASGFVVTTKRLAGVQLKNNQGSEQNSASKEELPIIFAYERLARTRRYGDAYVLALDPWFIFNKRTTPSLTRERIIAPDQSNLGGLLLLPGRDQKAVSSWTARLLQESPGRFIQDKAMWNEVRRNLFQTGAFQDGGFSYSWNEVIFTLLGNTECWVYAPVSRLRTLPDYRTTQIEAFVFPEPGDSFGLQAELLWLIPFGLDNAGDTKNLLDWLNSAEAQSVIAAVTTWIPAHPDCPPYNPVAQTARIAWLTSSFVWEFTE
ncbi:hypothetical protein [Leadbettera azotonutricia]|uniref:Uncharacterized protein n=1 Tax=Leadbettera azotonutricia (strain ATCC BAA-888 / DSM 13862 / ZAS-9) TaxID=545695 RepID=F5Y8S1_LEAAZ|nr:hypothetical protein [Leadbettera azotonutricia]AEF83002.1 hypothetical protein TREAZ_2185 [Leadbettera azotonutricia ZAS-9]